MKSVVEQIGPRKAQQLLDKYWVKEHQRKPSPKTVSSYARSMRAGNWLLTHQGIAIDDQDELIDGIHRLLAIVESGKIISIPVVRGVPHNGNGSSVFTIDAIDRGRERGVGQQLQLRHNMKNGSFVAAVCRSIMKLSYIGHEGFGKMSVSDSLAVLNFYGKEVNFVTGNRSRDYRVRNAPVCAAVAFAMKVCPQQMKEFYVQLSTGEKLKSGDPSLTCRRWLMSSDHRPRRYAEYRGVLTCAMKYVNQESLYKIYDTETAYNFFLEKQKQTVKKMLSECGFLKE